MTNRRAVLPLIPCFLLLATAQLGAATKVVVDFGSDIRPILARNCFACHGPDEIDREAEFRIDVREHATGETGGKVRIVPGNAEESLVYQRITNADEEKRMPPKGERLTAEDIQLIRTWIDQGAPYARHWAFVPPQRPEPPEVSNEDAVRNEIDRFVLARLESEGLGPSAEADKYTLIRRLALDLTGLPPDPELVAAFTREPPPPAPRAQKQKKESGARKGKAKEQPKPGPRKRRLPKRRPRQPKLKSSPSLL